MCVFVCALLVIVFNMIIAATHLHAFHSSNYKQWRNRRKQKCRQNEFFNRSSIYELRMNRLNEIWLSLVYFAYLLYDVHVCECV